DGARDAGGADGDGDARDAQGERDGPDAAEQRDVEVGARGAEEDDEDDAAHLLDGVQELLALGREVLNDEAGGEEGEGGVDVDVFQEVGEDEAEGEEDEEEMAPYELEVRRQDEAEGRAHGDAADDFAADFVDVG